MSFSTRQTISVVMVLNLSIRWIIALHTQRMKNDLTVGHFSWYFIAVQILSLGSASFQPESTMADTLLIVSSGKRVDCFCRAARLSLQMPIFWLAFMQGNSFPMVRPDRRYARQFLNHVMVTRT